VTWCKVRLSERVGRAVDEWTEPGQPAQAGKDTRIAGSGPYAVMPHPTDGSVWYTLNIFAGTPGFLRFNPKTKLSEFYAIPKEGIGVRGGDIDKNGVVWGSGSNGTLISFDRRKCKGQLNGPTATAGPPSRRPHHFRDAGLEYVLAVPAGSIQRLTSPHAGVGGDRGRSRDRDVEAPRGASSSGGRQCQCGFCNPEKSPGLPPRHRRDKRTSRSSTASTIKPGVHATMMPSKKAWISSMTCPL
jgi:hypothetical protein